jgi:hypothetical protein
VLTEERLTPNQKNKARLLQPGKGEILFYVLFWEPSNRCTEKYGGWLATKVHVWAKN